LLKHPMKDKGFVLGFPKFIAMEALFDMQFVEPVLHVAEGAQQVQACLA
jgi:hypothetical protein